MFEHSVKVPRLYKNASKIAQDVASGKGSIKQLVYEGKHPNIKALYALVVHVFQRSDELENLLKKSKLLVNEPRLNPWLAKILITELLWGKGCLKSECKPIKTVLGYEQIFKAHLSDVPEEEQLQVDKPRYVRINTIKIPISEAIDAFLEEGWYLKRHLDKTDYQGFLQAVETLTTEEFMVDIHIPELLIFPPKTHFYRHEAYRNGSIILQDKASCLAAHILRPEPGTTVLDMCAAPGMKSTHSAALIGNTGTVLSVEMERRRFEILDKMVEAAGATCVKTINRDVLTLTSTECPDVEYILVDPSCSGSGITDRVEIGQQKQDQDQQRLSKLAGFQIKILRHALTRFPKAKRVVYSTCSVFPEENEDVVRQVLETCTRFKLIPAAPLVGNAWMNFGSTDLFGEIGNYCLYARPEFDQTSGFFVAVFERLEEGEKNQFLHERVFALEKKGKRDKARQRSWKPFDVDGEMPSDWQNPGVEKDGVEGDVDCGSKGEIDDTAKFEAGDGGKNKRKKDKKKKKKENVNCEAETVVEETDLKVIKQEEEKKNEVKSETEVRKTKKKKVSVEDPVVCVKEEGLDDFGKKEKKLKKEKLADVEVIADVKKEKKKKKKDTEVVEAKTGDDFKKSKKRKRTEIEDEANVPEEIEKKKSLHPDEENQENEGKKKRKRKNSDI